MSPPVLRLSAVRRRSYISVAICTSRVAAVGGRPPPVLRFRLSWSATWHPVPFCRPETGGDRSARFRFRQPYPHRGVHKQPSGSLLVNLPGGDQFGGPAR